MKTQNMAAKDLIALVATVAPSVAIETIWERDEDTRWDIEDPSLDEDDFTAWQSEVKASAIVGGRMLTGSAYLGGTWEKFGDAPSKSNPDISGFFPQMLEEALRELGQQTTDLHIANQVIAALKAL